MKSLKPSHRENKRYLLVNGKDANNKVIEETILEFMGVLGYAEASPEIVKKRNGEVILAINRKSLDKIKASFAMSKKDLEVVRVSGSLKKVK